VELLIHTDGSSSQIADKIGAWAYCYSESSGSNSIFHYGSGAQMATTNNVMEVQAALSGIKYFTANQLYAKYKKVTVVSDSQYLCDTIYFGWISNWKRNNWIGSEGKPVKNQELWEELELSINILRQRNIVVDFRWVKGHNGNRHNEFCDELAGYTKRLYQDIKKNGNEIRAYKDGGSTKKLRGKGSKKASV